METNSPSDETASDLTPPATADPDAPPAAPEPPADDAGEPLNDEAAAEADELVQLAEASLRARLSQSDEERMGTLLRDSLMGGRAAVARAIDVMPKVPWIVSVRAVETTWPELTAGFRTQLLAGLAKDETDGSRRLRLSIARALFKIDQPVAMKLALGAVKEMRDKETGELLPKQAQIFANVFIGRAKPWLAQLSLAELKPAEAEALTQCAIMAAFTVPHPPITQLSVLKWARENDRLGQLGESALEAVKKTLSRWSAKWQSALRRELPELPEEIASALRPAQNPAPEREEAAGEREHEDEAAREESSEHPAEENEHDLDGDEEDDDEGDEREERNASPEGEEPPRKERPVYVPRPQREPGPGDEREREPHERPSYPARNAGGGQRFNLNEALRQIEAHVNALRSDLAAAQAKNRYRDDDRRRRPEKTAAIIEGEPTPDELARLNVQLEARNTELQARINDLAQHSEDVAVSMGVMSGEPIADTGAQLRTLLGLKLHEDYADFLALETESNDLVVQQHYKGLLAHVFEVLKQLEIPLGPAA